MVRCGLFWVDLYPIGGFLKKYLDGIFLFFYLSAMKNIKIPEKTHKELKVFAAKHNNEMSVVANTAIIFYMKDVNKSKLKSSKQ